ncbi:MAG: hypothetical protein MK078_09265 [Crocinitomicaceae bacterium]|nr:hypothetical protein [Crocinitomicaceae bacterium]
MSSFGQDNAAKIEIGFHESLAEVDEEANLNWTYNHVSRGFEVHVGNISNVADGLQFSVMLKDYICLLFSAEYGNYTGSIWVDLDYSRGTRYKYCQSPILYSDNAKTIEYTDYLKLVLTGFVGGDEAYYDLMMPHIKEFYPLLECELSFGELLTTIYFTEDTSPVLCLMLLYDNADFIYYGLPFTKESLANVFYYIGYEDSELAFDSINRNYMDFYQVDTIYTKEGEVYYY